MIMEILKLKDGVVGLACFPSHKMPFNTGC